MKSQNQAQIPIIYQNGVTQKCVISEIGLICSPGYDLSNPNIVGGGHACQDIYAGAYEPESESDNNFNLNNENDNSDSDNIPACISGVLQRCVIENIGLICSTEELTHDSDEPSIVGGGHACYNAYHGTYKPSPTLKTCKDGTLAMSCGMIGYASGSNNVTEDCEAWSNNLETKKSDIDKRRDVIDLLYLASQTSAEMDAYHAAVDKYNAERELVYQEEQRFNAECGT
jgi:hypothetical protein